MAKPAWDTHCFWCKKPYTTFSCTNETIMIDGQRYDRIRYGFEVYRERDIGILVEQFHKPEQCPDCGVGLKQLHHFCCDKEQCPRCRGQLLACNCSVVSR